MSPRSGTSRIARFRTSRMRVTAVPARAAERPVRRITMPIRRIEVPPPLRELGSVRRYWDARAQTWIVQVLPGELYVSEIDEMITTVLGSCVSTCVRDPHRKVGGVNHFMLPHAPRTGADPGAAARYGMYALEKLINQVLHGGGRRDDLEVKMFGGGRVIGGAGDIGAANVAFVRRFLEQDRMVLAAEDVGGQFARRLRYWPLTGRVQVKRMPMALAARVVDAEQRSAARLIPTSGPIEIF